MENLQEVLVLVYEMLHRLRHWHYVFKYKQDTLKFKEGSKLHMKYLKMKCDQQYRVLVKGNVIEDEYATQN